VKNIKNSLNVNLERLRRSRHPYLHEFLPYVKKQNAIILDLGCGLLQNSLYFVKNACYVIGIDLNFAYLLEGRKGFSGADIVCGDGKFLPFKTNTFNGIIVVDLLEHFPLHDVKKVIEEIIRVLKDQSSIFLHVPLEGNFAYQFLRFFRKIWLKDHGHKHNYRYWEMKKILNYFPVTIEREWVDKRLRPLKILNFSAVAVTFILDVRKIGDKNY